MRSALLPMFSLMWLWTAALWGPAAAGAAVGCVPSLQLGEVIGGGRTVILSAARNHSCHCARLELSYRPCRADSPSCDVGWDAVTPALQTVRERDGWTASGTVLLAGWYRARCCFEDKLDPCFVRSVAKKWVDGIEYAKWNVSISAEDVLGDTTQLSVEVARQMGPPTPDLFFPKLQVTLFKDTNMIDSGDVRYPENKSIVFGRERGLRPGEYRVDVKPVNVPCQGGCRARYITHVIDAPREPGVGEVSVDKARSNTLYVCLGVAAGAAVAGLAVYLSYSFLYGGRVRRWLERLQAGTEKRPPADHAAPPVTALLLHRGGPPAACRPLYELAASLRAAGVVVLDAQDGAILNLLQSHPCPADILAMEAFRDARLLFVGGGAAGGASSAAARIYDSFLRFVRNARLGQDYGRVFAATLDDSAGAELAGLVEGRLFRVPLDVPALVEHLRGKRPVVARLCSAGSQTGLLPAMMESPVSTETSLRASPV